MDGPLIWSFALLAIAVAIVVIEFFVPSGGLLAIAAIGAFIGSIAVAFTVSFKWGLGMITIVAAIVPCVLSATIRLWPQTSMGRRILNRIPGEPPPDVLPDDEHHKTIQSLSGQIGIAHTDLLPNGIIRINGQKYDAVVSSGAVDKGQFVEVYKVITGKIHVRPTTKTPENPSATTALEPTLSPLDQPIEDLGIESLEDPLA